MPVLVMKEIKLLAERLDGDEESMSLLNVIIEKNRIARAVCAASARMLVDVATSTPLPYYAVAKMILVATQAAMLKEVGDESLRQELDSLLSSIEDDQSMLDLIL